MIVNGTPDAGSPPEISVIIPHFSDLSGLNRCLTALCGQLDDVRAEIVVSDNASPQGQAAVAEVIAGRARLVMNPVKGAGPTRNVAVAAARAAFLAFTDADCLPEPGWLAAGRAALEKHDLVGGRVRVLSNTQGPMTGAEAFEHVFAFDNRRYVEREGFSVTANLFCRRSVYDRVGPFHNNVPEDLEWCHRARDLGYAIGYADDAVVGHPARRDWQELSVKWKRLNAESFGYSSATRGGRARWLMRSWLLPASIIAHAPRIWRSPALRNGRERRAALATLIRLRMWRWADAHKLVFAKR